MKTKQTIKQGFDNNTFDTLTGWKNNGDTVWLTHDFDLWVIDGGDVGRKAFKTFSGAFNLFMKGVQGNNVDISLTDTDGDFINIDNLCAIHFN
jgi:hypothetical protein